MSIKQNITKQLLAILTVSMFLVGSLSAQTTPSSAQSENDRASERENRDNKKTKKSQAVSKGVYAKITKAQE